MTPTSQGAVQALPWPAWLNVLSAVFPPRSTVVVGAGAGNGPWVQWLRSRPASPVWLVEGDEAQYQHLLRHLPEGCDWTPRRDVVAPAPAPTLFYRASNPAENGLIPPERLRTLWPHLAEEGVVEVEAPVTLEALLAEAGDEANWLVLDCLPAAQLLQGGAARLGQLDVALVRVAAGENAGLDRAARHDAVDELLATAGLVCVHTRTERHPALAHALYVREPAGLRAQLAQARSQAAIGHQRIDDLTHSLHAARQALEEAKQSHALTLQQAQADASRREAVLRQQQEAQSQARAEDEKRTAAWQAENEAWRREREGLLQARDQAVKQSDSRLAQIQALEKRIRDLLARQADNKNLLLSNKKQKKLFIDCGGHDGCSAIKYLLANSDFDAISFEPNPIFWDYYLDIPTLLQKKAVATHNNPILFTIDPVDGDGSSYVDKKRIDTTGQKENSECPQMLVDCIDVSEFIRDAAELYEEVVLKLDVEGAEYEILQKMILDGTLGKVSKLLCEFHWQKIGMSEAEHIALLEVIQRQVPVEEWDALEFSVHGRKSQTLMRIRSELKKSLRREAKGEIHHDD